MLLTADDEGNLLRLVSSSEATLDKAQLQNLLPGEIPIDGPAGMHAETKLVFTAEERGLTPLQIAVSRPICGACAELLAKYNIAALTPLKRP